MLLDRFLSKVVANMSQYDLRLILSGLAEPVFLLRSNRQILLTNKAAEELFGSGLDGRDFVHAIRDPDGLKCVESVLLGELISETQVTISIPERVIFRLSAMYLDVRDEIDIRAMVTLHDISHIQEAEQMRSDFVANVSHELRSPLTALIGGIETLKGAARSDVPAQLRFLDIMDSEAARMNRLVGDLLSLSQVEANERRRPSELVDILAIAKSVIATLETQARVENKKIGMVCDADFLDVLGDRDELTQVFHNLIDNAIKYSSEKSQVQILVSNEVHMHGFNGTVVKIEVNDRGEGISSENISRLTERFFRVDDGRSREKGGTGLGLAIVKHVLNRHRGRLAIESQLGVGSTFKVFLPCINPETNDQSS
jgi:two-component system phosphate regulon sensor histidine kinase PhoR